MCFSNFRFHILFNICVFIPPHTLVCLFIIPHAQFVYCPTYPVCTFIPPHTQFVCLFLHTTRCQRPRDDDAGAPTVAGEDSLIWLHQRQHPRAPTCAPTHLHLLPPAKGQHYQQNISPLTLPCVFFLAVIDPGSGGRPGLMPGTRLASSSGADLEFIPVRLAESRDVFGGDWM